MADEPSIDEILASLDELLKEGKGRNDEPGEASPLAGEPETPPAHDAPTPHFFEVLDDEIEAGHAGAGTDAAEPRETPETGPSGAETPQQAGETPGVEPGHASRLYVLTDAMMVEDQPFLPLAMGEGSRAAEEDEEAMRQALAMPEATVPGHGTEHGEVTDEDMQAHEGDVSGAGPEPGLEPEPESDAVIAQAPVWDEAAVQALVDQVTDDVCSAMAEQLPEMIRIALQHRLAAFIEARTKHQDTGNQA